ncbi:MAG: cyclic nucleotide-binding domain-containing protein [Rhodospirillales bacterium]|nr:cyclic nucleotide-binding domain-containing protein [Alphaproteobacteria bacterium]MBL6948799.1 cyclic nucleotide-binding domain-containing protein [Rhodospirillales bacterium]
MVDSDLISYVDMIGYLGGVVTVWGLYQKTMIPLRVGAVCGNVGFLIFGILAGSNPTFVVHALLLPLNAYRMIQMMRLVREMHLSTDEANTLEPLIPFMKREKKKAGAELFAMGDTPDRMILIKSGIILLKEIDVRCHEGEVLGEIAMFTPDGKRTCTAVCETDCELFTLSNEAMAQLFAQNPRFAMFLMRVIVKRLLDNWHEADERSQARVTG